MIWWSVLSLVLNERLAVSLSLCMCLTLQCRLCSVPDLSICCCRIKEARKMHLIFLFGLNGENVLFYSHTHCWRSYSFRHKTCKWTQPVRSHTEEWRFPPVSLCYDHKYTSEIIEWIQTGQFPHIELYRLSFYQKNKVRWSRSLSLECSPCYYSERIDLLHVSLLKVHRSHRREDLGSLILKYIKKKKKKTKTGLFRTDLFWLIRDT